jgi:hypothetical protein
MERRSNSLPVKFAEDLRVELERISPEWEWFSEEQKAGSPDLISPKTIQVFGKNRHTGEQTIPLHVSALPNAKTSRVATFICEVLMLTSSKGESSKPLLS